jgi:hypothetical protein
VEEDDDDQADDQVRGDDRRLQLLEGRQPQQRVEQGAEQPALDEPVLVAEQPVKLGVDVEGGGDPFENPDDAGEGARGERKIGGAAAGRVEGAQIGGRRGRGRGYCRAPVTTTLVS